MSATSLEINTASPAIGLPTRNPAELAAFLLGECGGLKPTKDVPTDRSYVASLKQLAFSRLRAALLSYQTSDGGAIARCADSVESHRYLSPMMRLHLAPALRAVTHGELAPFVAAELVSACIAAEGWDDAREYFADIASVGLNELAGAVELLAEAIDEAN
jgi:hypothetical protein